MLAIFVWVMAGTAMWHFAGSCPTGSTGESSDDSSLKRWCDRSRCRRLGPRSARHDRCRGRDCRFCGSYCGSRAVVAHRKSLRSPARRGCAGRLGPVAFGSLYRASEAYQFGRRQRLLYERESTRSSWRTCRSRIVPSSCRKPTVLFPASMSAARRRMVTWSIKTRTTGSSWALATRSYAGRSNSSSTWKCRCPCSRQKARNSVARASRSGSSTRRSL